MFDYKEIITFFKKNFTWRDILISAIIIILYFATRLINLDNWPIFSDEGIYIRWAKVAARDPSWRFISLTDGRQPLQTWGTIPFLKLFPENALLAGRLFSVSSGFAALLGMFTLNYYLWGKRGAFISTFLYVFIPYFVLYDRFALIDSAVNAGFIWLFFFSIVIAKTRRFDMALLMGVVGGISLLAKSTSRMFIMIAAAAPILFISDKRKEFIHKSINYFILLGIALVIALAFYNIQRLSPFFHYIEMKNTTFVMTFDEFINNPFGYFKHNVYLIPWYVAWEAGWIIVLFSLAGLTKLFKKDIRLFIYILAFIITPWIAIAFFAKILFPRYLIFFASILIITATYYFTTLKSKTQIALLGILLATMIVLDYPLIFNPVKASFPAIDKGQYIEGASAVWGADELMTYLREQSQQKPVLIIAEGNFGLVGDVLDVFVHEGDKIEIKGEWPLDESHLYEYQPDLKDRQVFLVFSHREEFPDHWPMELVKTYTKPGNKKNLYLYKLKAVNTDSENAEESL